MAGIFANSYLTIAGLASANSQEPFLIPRRKAESYVQLDNPVGDLYLRRELHDFANDVEKSALY